MATSSTLGRPPASTGMASPRLSRPIASQPAPAVAPSRGRAGGEPQRQSAATVTHRDRFIDVVLTFAILAIVGQHWLLPVVSDDGADLTGSSLTVLGGWESTWLSPVMPLIFFAGGATAANSLRIRQRLATATDRLTSSWLAARTIELAVPVIPLAVAWLPLSHLMVAAGIPAQPAYVATDLVGRLLWFLAAYAVLTSLTPVMLRVHDRCQGREVIVMAGIAIAVEVARFTGSNGPSWLGHTTVLLVLAAAYQVGVAYSHGQFDHVRRSRLLALSAGGLAASALAIGAYAVSVITMPGDVSTNLSPLALLALGAVQVSLALALRGVLSRWAAHGPAGAMLDWFSARTLRIYLWHVPALAMVAGLAVMAFGHDAPQPFGAGWYSNAPLRLAALAVVLAAFVRAFGHYERRARWHLARHGSRSRASLNPNSPVCRMGTPAPGRKT